MSISFRKLQVSCTGLYADVYRRPLTYDADVVVAREFQMISDELASKGKLANRQNVIYWFFSWTEIERQRDEVACRAAAEVGDQGHPVPHQAALGGKTQAASSHGPVQQLQGQLCQELRLWSCGFKSK